MTITSSRFFSYEPPTPPAIALTDAERNTPAPGQRSSKPWLGLRQWIQQNTFSPNWLPDPLRRPLAGYVLAGSPSWRRRF